MSVLPLLLAQLGGSAGRGELLEMVTVATLNSALKNGDVARDRRVCVPDDVDLRFRTLPDTEVDGPATTPLRTVIDSARGLPLPEALAVADSALRSGTVTRRDLTEVSLPRTRRARARFVLDQATGNAANPSSPGCAGSRSRRPTSRGPPSSRSSCAPAGPSTPTSGSRVYGSRRRRTATSSMPPAGTSCVTATATTR